MLAKNKLKIFFLVLLFLVTISCFFLLMGYRFYRNVFRLSYDEIVLTLKDKPSECKKMSDCKLLPGDILIRRYVTPVTKFIDSAFNPYFTHSAYYLGNDELFEALGNYAELENQILISKLSESDWMNEDMENFVIVRPTGSAEELENVANNLRSIADDPEYLFGPMKEGRKTASCSDIILKYLIDEEVISILPKKPSIITPDYLYWVTENDELGFKIVGYNIKPKSLE